MSTVALTTFDNPYNPFEQFSEWFQHDEIYGYDSCGKLARISQTHSSMTDEEYNVEVERAIDQIVLNDPTGMYRKVTPDSVFGAETIKLIQ